MTLLERLVVCLLPIRSRDTILGDLLEEEIRHTLPRRQKLWSLLGIAIHYQIEPYRDSQQRVATALAAAIGVGLLWLVPIASRNLFVDPDLLTAPVIRISTFIWGASHVTSAIAAGLFFGRSSLLPSSTPPRWHLGIALAAAAFALSSGFDTGIVAVFVLAAAAWVGDMARVEGRLSE